MTVLPRKVEIVGSGISDVSMRATIDLVLNPPDGGLSVAVCNVHSVMASRRNPRLHDAIAQAGVATPDGMPLVWALNALEPGSHQRVDGYRLFHETIKAGIGRSTRHFLYGSTSDTLDELSGVLRTEYPGIEIAGILSPPFRTQTADEGLTDLAVIRASNSDVVWVGLGMPKQEIWMNTAKSALPGISLVGVGAVFDWVAGNVPKAPDWMQRSGLEWLYRLAKEPRRLWRRYAWNNPAYLVLLTIQVLRGRRSRARS